MITAKHKPLDEVWALVVGAKSVLVVGCGGCATVRNYGGAKEVGLLAQELKLKAKQKRRRLTVAEAVVLRQCEPEFSGELADRVKHADVVVSVSCGAGPQVIAELFPRAWVVPGVDTVYVGGVRPDSALDKYCIACGRCVVHLTGGVCPRRCPKTLLNGPCGGVHDDGLCEVEEQGNCIWVMIYERMRSQDRLDEFMAVRLPEAGK